jgi:hypothetical protein
MGPLGQLVRRVDRVLVLLMGTHCRSMVLKGVGRHALIDIIRHLNVASKLDIVVLSSLSATLFATWVLQRTYSKFTNLHVVDAKHLLFLARTELKHREESSNKVQAAENKTGSDERVRTTRDGVGELVPKLHPVTVEPATLDNGGTVEMSYVVA